MRPAGSSELRRTVWAAILAILLAPWAQAQEVREASDWKKMYDDASLQLRAAQDRKSEMAKQITDLTARISALQTQLQAAEDALNALHHQTESTADRNHLLNSIYSGWESFTLQNADIRTRWQAYWAFGLASYRSDFPIVANPQWPLFVP
jgi:predicted nuclease with TOPRIM domain